MNNGFKNVTIFVVSILQIIMLLNNIIGLMEFSYGNNKMNT